MCVEIGSCVRFVKIGATHESLLSSLQPDRADGVDHDRRPDRVSGVLLLLVPTTDLT